MVRMHNPPHPGEVLADTVVRRDGGISVTEFAKALGVSRVALSRVVNGRAAVSAELAIRLAAALGGSAESWLNMQVAYDLWQAEKRRRPERVLVLVRIQEFQQRRFWHHHGCRVRTFEVFAQAVKRTITLGLRRSVMRSSCREVP